MRIGSVSPLPDSPQNRRLAALLHKYQHVHNSDYTQTALAIIMHDAFDTTTGAAGWAATRETLQQYPQLFKRVDELLASDYTQTALAIIMHDAFDTTTGAAGWAATRETLQQYPQLFKRVDELLA